jgi:protein ImuB
MRRVVSLYLPTWPTDRLRRKLGAWAPTADTPIVLFGRQSRRREVMALDAAARNAGLRIGMPASKAQVLVPGLVNLELDPTEDAAALDRLALWALRYAPIVAADPPDGLIIDTGGADHLHGGEAAMLTSLVDRMEASGIAARAAVADAWGTAHAAARFLARPIAIIPPGQAAPPKRVL